MDRVWRWVWYHLPDADGRIGPEHLDTMVEQFRLRTGDRAPLWTCIGVAALAGPKMRVEIQVAVIVDDRLSAFAA